MRSSLFLSASMLIAASRLAASAQLQGITTDKAGSPLAGVVVKLVSTGESTVSDQDGSWRLGGSTKVEPRTAVGTAKSGILSRRGGRIVLDADGFRLDGRRGMAGGGVALPQAVAGRTAESPVDTIEMRWKEAMFRIPLAAGAPADMGPTELDTAGLGLFAVRTWRSDAAGTTILRIDIVSGDTTEQDSLRLRLHLDGTASEMADFAARLDIAQLYTAAGFNEPANLDRRAISETRPRLLDGTCPAERRCAWTFDIPLAPVTFSPASRLALAIIPDRHALEGDTTALRNLAPTHDPFAGSDWSFRPHVAGATIVYTGIPWYPLEAEPASAPLAPYIQILRGDRVLYGRAPTPEN